SRSPDLSLERVNAIQDGSYKQKKPEMRPFCSCRQRPASLYNVLIVVGFQIITIAFGAKAAPRFST
ncbi:hypothetical protein RCJ83_14190, partial [Salmonella enterica subsp. enterica serovar Agona]